MIDEPMFSPTDMEDWLVCPRYRALKKAWMPRTGEWSPALAAGRALHKGMEVAYESVLKTEQRPAVESSPAVVAAMVTLRECYQEHPTWTLARLEHVVTQGVERTMAYDIGGIPLHVEHQVERGRLDLLVRLPDGELLVIDYKTILTADDSGVALRGRDLETGQQRFYYPWAVERQFGQRPKWMTFLQIVLVPLSVRPLTFEVTPAAQQEWRRSAGLIWRQMQVDDLGGVTWMNTRSCYRYGRKCEFWDACHVLHNNVESFDALYLKRPGVKDAV